MESLPNDLPSMDTDIESSSDTLLVNNTIRTFSWADIDVEVTSRTDKKPLALLNKCSGFARAGEVVALMGPSGSGKTTLLNVLANRSQSQWQGSVMVDGHPVQKPLLRSISCYVEQEDALIGSLTVRETVEFAARLATPGLSKSARLSQINSLIKSFGLSEQSDTIIGTPIRKGISGGQKRRVSIASQLVTSPQILFLDEPTSGLDSTASYQVMKFIAQVAKKYQLIVIASIHQPSTSTFNLFDKMLLLARGNTCYFGPVREIRGHFSPLVPVPELMNPAEFLLELVNDDFQSEPGFSPDRSLQLSDVIKYWRESPHCMVQSVAAVEKYSQQTPKQMETRLRFDVPWILLHRNWIKSYRDVLTYGTRVAMYIGLAIMMGTVWLRLPYTQESIASFITALFFSGAFMSFMAVAYVPSIIEDLHNLRKEHANGLSGPFTFTVANFFIGIPWLALITILFSIITYWLCNFHNTANGFWLWNLWLFLDLLAAEGLVVLLSSIFPTFVVALAATAFANGLWMSVGGFLVPLGTLNVFWKYVFHYIDYQAYVFQAMMVNQFRDTVYSCDRTPDGSLYCMYPSDLQSQGLIRGTAVLDRYQYSHRTGKMWESFGIMIAIILVYRILGFAVISFKLQRQGT